MAILLNLVVDSETINMPSNTMLACILLNTWMYVGCDGSLKRWKPGGARVTG